MKVVLVQLPVPDNRLANLPLALGYLKAAAEAAKLPGLEVRLLEAAAQNRGGDAFVVDSILKHDPDLVGFSLYTWNSSRALGLAGMLKQQAPEIRLIGGGPEVNFDGDFVLSSLYFDFLVVGEGERTFVELLAALHNRSDLSGIRGLAIRKPPATKGPPQLIELQAPSLFAPALAASGREALSSGQWQFAPAQTALANVNSVPSAYLSGALEGHVGRFMSIELSRWCPSRCTFCYYGRQDLPRGGQRYFEVERIRQELLWGQEHGIEQVHFVEANFNTLPHLDQLYATIKASGANRSMSFYAELRGEAINPGHAQTLAECNFGMVEVGLQSAVPEVLAKVRRKNNLPRLVEGVRNLRVQGIEVLLDVILGLPGETAQTFRQTLDFMEAHDLLPYDLFHLQMLSGTQLKAEAAAGQHGLRWQAAPPYFVVQTETLSFEELGRLRLETLERTGRNAAQIPGHSRPGPYALTEIDDAYDCDPDVAEPIERLVLDFTGPGYHPAPAGQITTLARRAGSEVTIWLKLGLAREQNLAAAELALQILSRPNPSTCWHVFVESEHTLSPASYERLRQAIYHQEGYLDRLGVFALAGRSEAGQTDWPSVNFYRVLTNPPANEPTPGDPALVLKINLEETTTAAHWQARIKQALETGGEHLAGLHLVTPPGCNPARLKEALHDLNTGPQQLWLADWKLAGGLAYAWAEDSAEALDSLNFPLTAFTRPGEGPIATGRPGREGLFKAALGWTRAATPAHQPHRTASK